MHEQPVHLVFSQGAAGDANLRFGDDGAGAPGQPSPPDGPADLVFRQPPAASADLVFGDDNDPGGPEPGGTATLALHASLPPLRARAAHLRASIPLALRASLPGLQCRAGVQYQSNTARPVVGRAVAGWQSAAALGTSRSAAHQSSAPQPAGAQSPWQRAQPTTAAIRHPLPAVLLVAQIQRGARHQNAQPSGLGAAPVWQSTTRAPHQRGGAWQNAAPHQRSARLRHQNARRAHARRATGWHPTRALHTRRTNAWQPAQRAHRRWRAPWQTAMRPPAGVRVHPPIQPPAGACYTPSAHLLYRTPADGSPHLLFVCDAASGPGPQPGATIVVPIRGVYAVINSIDLIRIDGSHPLPAYTFGLRLDADSWTWQWSATLHKDALPLLQPAQAGTPVEVQATINGVAYRLLVESVRRAREFASTRIEVSGRGLAALLDAPYAPVQAFGNQAPRSAQQLMTDVLTINGVGMGWALDFGLTDWQVPAGAFAHQGTWISAINTIAQAAGGYVQPHPTAQTLRILHRYPVAPWAWGGLTPDIDLPMAPVAVEGVEWVAKPAYNRVFVSGEGVGVLADVKRAGTPGDLAAPMVVDALITDTDAATQRGRAILSDTGSQALATLTLQVLPETGLILPGRFVRRTDSAETLQGLVRATSLTWDAPRMRQTIEVQTHHA